MSSGAVRLAGTLWLFWYMHGHVTEARRWLRRALDAAPDEPSEARAKLLYGAGYLAYEQNENEEALALLEAELRLREGDRSHRDGRDRRRRPLPASGPRRTSSTSDRRAALAVGEEAVALARAAGDDFVLAIALNNLGGVTALLGDNERAAAYFEESLEVRRRIGDLSRIALSLANVAEMALNEGKTDQGCRHVRRGGRDRHRDRRQTAHPLRARRARPGRLPRRAMGGRRHAHAGKPAPRTGARHEATRGGDDPRPRRDRHGHG